MGMSVMEADVSNIHELVLKHGKTQARMMVSKDRVPVVDTAARILEEASNELGITYSGFCLTALPHKKLPNDQEWVRQNGQASLMIEPGRIIPQKGAAPQLIGVPYGPKARLILLYLQTRAVKTKSREVEIGKSMHDWLKRMDITASGKSYSLVREQAERISRCRLTFFFNDNQKKGFRNDHIISGGISFQSNENQSSLWEDTVFLGESFYQALTAHPVPVWEPAIRELSARSMAIDIYIWLSYRLHVLNVVTPISWAALYNQFGAGFKAIRQFKPEFRRNLDFALAVYPEARVEERELGIELVPSPSPVPERLILS